MKICHVITRLVVGGAQENTVATCIGLRRRGHDVDLVIGPQTGAEGSIRDQALAHGVPLRIVEELHREPNPWLDVRACGALTRLFRERRYDVVHTHSGKAGFVGRLAAKRAGIPIIVHTIHGPSFYPYQDAVLNWLCRWAEQVASEWTTQFISVADAMTEQYLAAAIGLPAQYVTIHSGMDVEAFARAKPDPELRAALGLAETDRVVGMVARLFRLKGHEYLFEAAPRIVGAVPNVKFLLVGDGIYRNEFERQTRRLGLEDRFLFAGLVPPREMPRYLVLMDLLVHLSLREGLPRALPQALACGKPVVAFDVDGAREVCLDGQTGRLIPAEDSGALADAVIPLLRDRVGAARMGEQGRELVREPFSEELMVRRIDELYQTLKRLKS